MVLGLLCGVWRYSGVMLCGVFGYGCDGRGVVEDAALDPPVALFFQDASLTLRYAQDTCTAL